MRGSRLKRLAYRVGYLGRWCHHMDNCPRLPQRECDGLRREGYTAGWPTDQHPLSD